MNPYYNPAPPVSAPSGGIGDRMGNSMTEMFSDKNFDWDKAEGYAAAGAGLLSLGGDWAAMSRQGLGLEGREMPSLNAYAGDYYNRADNARVQRTSGGEILGGAVKGAVFGSKLGLPGAAAGAVIGGVGTIFAGNSRRRRQQHEKDEALSDALSYQSDYNRFQNTADQQAVSAADYTRRLDSYHQNLYSWTAI